MKQLVASVLLVVYHAFASKISAVGSLNAPSPNIASIYRSVLSYGDGKDNASASHILLKIVHDPSFLLAEHDDDDRIQKKLPVVLFLSGADCPHDSYMWLAVRLAKIGFCVALSSCVVPFGDTTCLLSTPYDVSRLNSLQDYRTKGPETDGLLAILNELKSLNNDDSSTSILAGKLDLERIVVGGHSSGGRTALDLVAFAKNRPFPIQAVFTYGASLVNSGGGAFLPRNSVLPCEADDRMSPPTPLLLLGGAQDGVSAALSQSNDATETLRRTMDESFAATGNGIADLIVLENANHMVFCAPVDPTCGAMLRDRPLVEDKTSKNENTRRLLGDVICEFLQCHGLPQHGTVRPFQPKIPSSLLHLSSSVRPRRNCTVPPMSIIAAIDERNNEECKEYSDNAWESLSSALEGCMSRIISELQLKEVVLSKDAQRWSAGNLTGTLHGWQAPSLVEWAVRYTVEEEKKTDDASAQSLGFTVWLSSSSSSSLVALQAPPPHLTVHVSVRGGKATLMGDHIPRKDLAMHPEYLEKYYSNNNNNGTAHYSWSALQKSSSTAVRSFTSSDPTIRAIQSPYALALSTDVNNQEGIDLLAKVLDDHCNSWLDFVQQDFLKRDHGASARVVVTAKNDNNDKMAKNDDDNDVAAAVLADRDLALRRVLRNHERAAGEPFMGPELAATLADHMVGFIGRGDDTS